MLITSVSNTAREHGVILHLCSPAVSTAREHGQWTRVECTELKRKDYQNYSLPYCILIVHCCKPIRPMLSVANGSALQVAISLSLIHI